MKVAELYRQKSFVFSIEIYPPKTQESLERLKIKLKEFRSYHPDFISVTYGLEVPPGKIPMNSPPTSRTIWALRQWPI